MKLTIKKSGNVKTYHFKGSLTLENGVLNIDPNQPESFRRRAREAGFPRNECCALNMHKKECLWAEERHD